MRWPRSPWSRSTAVAASAVALLLVGGVLAGVGGARAAEAVRREQDAARTGVVTDLALRVSDVFERADAAAAAAAPEDPVVVRDLRNAVVTQVSAPLTENPVIVDATGVVIATHLAERLTLGTELDAGQRRAATDYVAAAIDNDRTAFALVDRPDALDPPVIRVARPLHNADGDPVALFVSGLPVTEGVVAELLGAAGAVASAGFDAQLLLLADQRALTASGATANAGRATGAMADVGRRVAVRLEAGAGSAQPLAVAARGGTPVVAYAAGVTDGWHVVLYQPQDELVAARAAAQRLVWVLVAIATVVALTPLAFAERRVRTARGEVERAKRSLLAVAGHELRTPLTVVRGMAATVLRRWETLPDPMRKQLVGTIDRQARTLDHLIERLLFAAHVDSGVAGTVNVSAIDIAPVVADAADHHRALTPTHQIRARIDRPLMAQADAKALDQVLFHLLDNAVKFSPAGGEITITAGRVGNSVEIAVTDPGVGLPANATRIFDRFGQTEAVDRRTSEEGGVGLGLYIVKMLTKLMGGQVRAEPAEPLGSTFTVSLRGDIA